MDVPDCFRRYAHYHRFRLGPLHHAWAETRSQLVPDDDYRLNPDCYFASVTSLHGDFFPLATHFFQRRLSHISLDPSLS